MAAKILLILLVLAASHLLLGDLIVIEFFHCQTLLMFSLSPILIFDLAFN